MWKGALLSQGLVTIMMVANWDTSSDTICHTWSHTAYTRGNRLYLYVSCVLKYVTAICIDTSSICLLGIKLRYRLKALKRSWSRVRKDTTVSLMMNGWMYGMSVQRGSESNRPNQLRHLFTSSSRSTRTTSDCFVSGLALRPLYNRRHKVEEK